MAKKKIEEIIEKPELLKGGEQLNSTEQTGDKSTGETDELSGSDENGDQGSGPDESGETIEEVVVEEVKIEVSEDLVIKANALIVELNGMFLGGPGQKALSELKEVLERVD